MRRVFILAQAALLCVLLTAAPLTGAAQERAKKANGKNARTAAGKKNAAPEKKAPAAHNFARWEKEIAAYEAQDRESPPPQGAILFTGASSIRMWTTLARDFPDHQVINRGFGGCEVEDCTYYADRIVIPYAPRAIFLGVGGNDLNAGKTPERVAADFKAFIEKVRAKLPKTEIFLISQSPRISRWAQADAAKKLNELVVDYVKKTPGLKYIDCWSITITPEGKPREEVFAADKLHYNAAGYKLLAERVRPFLP